MKQQTEKPPTIKQEAFATAMYTIGSLTLGNGTNSAKEAKYTGNENTLAMTASRLIRNDKIIALKEQIQADTKKEMGITKQGQLDKLRVFHDLAVKQGNVSGGRSVIHEENELCGLLQDKAPNVAKVASQRALMADETKRVAEELALILTRKHVDSVTVISDKVIDSKEIEHE